MTPDLPSLWRQGVIAPWYLYDYQLDVYAHNLPLDFPFTEATRRGGKTTIELVTGLEEMISREAFIWRWCEPWKNQCREIVMPEVNRINNAISGLPSKWKLKFYTTDSFYELPATGSRLYLRGVNEDKGESARGSFAHRISADEFGSWRDPMYIKNEVLMPQLLSTDGKLSTLSTPPRDLGHPYYDEKKVAMREGRFVQFTIKDVTYLSQKQKGRMCQAIGGPLSTAWRREFLCEEITDKEALVIPEYNPELHDVPDDYPRPDYFDAYVGADLGFHDWTFLVFGYWDFQKAELVIEGEEVFQAKNSREIAETALAQERALWAGTLPYETQGRDKEGNICPAPYLRVSDNDPQQLHDMATLHGYPMIAMRKKDEKLAMVNGLRLLFQQGKVRIKKRCQNLRFQLRVGLWNDKKTSFERGEKTGHLDGIDALIYLSRSIDPSRNPYPLQTFHREKVFVSNTSRPGGDGDALSEALSFRVR